MLLTLVLAFVVSAALIAITFQHSAQEAARQAASALKAEESRGYMARPPKSSWTLGPGHKYIAFLSHVRLQLSNRV